MIHLELFGHSHQFQIADQSPEMVQEAIALIQNLSQEIPTLIQKERSYLLLLIRIAMMYQMKKADLGALEGQIGKFDEVCAMIEKSLAQSQPSLVHEAPAQSDF